MQPALGLQTAPHHVVGAGFLDLGDDRRIVLLSGVDAFVQHILDAELVHVVARGVRQALAVGRLVVDDGDLLALELVAGQFRPQHALLVVTAAGAERVPQLAVGDLRIGGCRRDEQDAVLRIDVGRGDRDARIKVADHELDAVADELVGDGNALLGIGYIVAGFERDLLAKNAAGLVDVIDGLLRSVDELCAESRVRPGDRAGDGHLICALAPAENTRAAVSATPVNQCLVILFSHKLRASGPP